MNDLFVPLLYVIYLIVYFGGESVSQTNPAISSFSRWIQCFVAFLSSRRIQRREVVFNTSMSGYQEILTDPSYCKQIVTLTYPHIGNVGLILKILKSNQVFASGLVIRDLSQTVSNWRSTQLLSDYLKANKLWPSPISTRAS